MSKLIANQKNAILNKGELDKFIWDCTQIGGTCKAFKAMLDGEMVNVAWSCSITGAAIAVQYRSQADSNRIAELEKALKAVKKDLLMRAEEDSDGVVELSWAVWLQLKEALKEQGK